MLSFTLFNGRRMKTKAIKIYDTTLRDGGQASDINFTLEEKLEMVREFDAFGIDYIEVGWPRPGSLDEEVYRRAAKLDLKHSKIVAFGSTRKIRKKVTEDVLLEALVRSGAPVVTIFGKSWLMHVEQQLKATPRQNLKAIADSVGYLKKNRVRNVEEVIFDAEHFFEGHQDNPEYALETLKSAVVAGANAVVLCDTNGGMLPHEISGIVAEVNDFIETDPELRQRKPALGIHAHNDSEMGVANTIEAIRAGATHIQGTTNGLGERVGNANLTSILPIIGLKTKYKLPKAIKLSSLSELSRKVYRLAGLKPDDSLPFCGSKAFAHDGSVHVDALLKGASYQHVVPELVGNKMRISLSTNSGKASVWGVVRSMGFKVKKNDPRLDAMLKEIHEVCGEGFNLSILDDEHRLLVLKHFSKPKTEIDIVRCDVTSHYIEYEHGVDHDNSCILKMTVDGKEYRAFADEENGPVAINFKAIKHILEEAGLPTKFHLTRYEVGLPKKGAAGAGSKIQTYITYESEDGRVITTSGYHEDIIVSSRQSLIKAAWLLAEESRIKKTKKKKVL
jgi:2-isopropylmalate synthase